MEFWQKQPVLLSLFQTWTTPNLMTIKVSTFSILTLLVIFFVEDIFKLMAVFCQLKESKTKCSCCLTKTGKHEIEVSHTCWYVSMF